MGNSKNTKRAFLASILSMIMCAAMLIGSTFAWFTDSVTSGNNKIQAGNLDVELEYSTNFVEWHPVTEETNLFKEDAKWEPGYTEVVYLKVSNAGSLALKYKFAINAANKVLGKTEDDKDIDLSDFIKFGIVDEVSQAYTQGAAGRAEARKAVAADAKLISEGYSKEECLMKGTASKVMAMVVYMPEEIGNEANHGTGKQAPSVDLGIHLVATQDTVESDSFDNRYDAGAGFPVEASTIEEINDAIKNSSFAEITLGSGAYVKGTINVSADKTVKLMLNEGSAVQPDKTYGIRVKEGGELTLSGKGMISGDAYQIPVSNSGNLTINDNITINLTNPGLTEGVLSNAGTGTLYISDGAYTASGRSGVGVKNAGGHAYISGGSFKGEMYAFFTSGNGVTEISGGTFEGTIFSTNGTDQSSITTISGGNFKNGSLKVENQSKIVVTGGTFTGYTLNNVNQFVADGYQAVEQDGVITVTASQ